MKKSIQSLMMGGSANTDHHHHHQHNDHGIKGWGFGGGEKEKVTPFPMDLGQGQGPPPPSKKKDKNGNGGTKLPTLLDMQQSGAATPNSANDWRGANGHYDSPATNNYPYLPPGARPPSPPPPLRPSTPTRFPYSNTPSQSSQTSVHPIDETTPRITTGRDRGYSSASEHEPVTMPRMYPVRSPLAFNDNGSGQVDIRPPPPQQQFHSGQQSHPHPMPDDTQRSFMPEEPKEKKKFWGVAWGEKKEKDRGHERERERDRGRERPRTAAEQDLPPPPRPPADDRRPSFEGAWRENESIGHGSNGHHSQSGHLSQTRHQAMAPQGTGYEGYTVIDSAENVTQAIGQSPHGSRSCSAHLVDLLVPFPDPPMSAIYAVCDRVNQSQTPDSICKEAAKALRKHFKHGNEGERKATAKMWLIMMRNIGNPTFRRESQSR